MQMTFLPSEKVPPLWEVFAKCSAKTEKSQVESWKRSRRSLQVAGPECRADGADQLQ